MLLKNYLKEAKQSEGLYINLISSASTAPVVTTESKVSLTGSEGAGPAGSGR
jgi:hypothetical protein